MLTHVITMCTISLSLTTIPEHCLLSSHRSRCIQIFFDNQFSMRHMISSVSPSHSAAICVSYTHMWGGAEIVRHTHDCVTNDLSPSIDPSHMQCCNLWSTHSPVFPPTSTGTINPSKVRALPATSAFSASSTRLIAHWHLTLVTL